MFFAVTFARGGSKGVKDKNIRNFAGKPLIVWTIEQVNSIDLFQHHIISTDDAIIRSISQEAGAHAPFLRPKALSKDTSKEVDAWKHAVEFLLKCGTAKLDDVFVSLPTTSPLRQKEDILRAINLFKRGDHDMVVGISESAKHPAFNMVVADRCNNIEIYDPQNVPYSRRQETPSVYDITTCFYVASMRYVLQCDDLFSGRVGAVKVEKEFSIDIDTELDFQIAEYLFVSWKKNERQV